MAKFYKDVSYQNGKKQVWSGEVDIDFTLLTITEQNILRNVAKLLGYTEDV